METLKKEGLLFTGLTLEQNNMAMRAAAEILSGYGIKLKLFTIIFEDWFCRCCNSSTKVQSIKGSLKRYGYDIFFISDTFEQHEIGDVITDYLHQNNPQFFNTQTK